jgi:phospholipid/cholesterol/gamma-HCH transport system permease protein
MTTTAPDDLKPATPAATINVFIGTAKFADFALTALRQIPFTIRNFPGEVLRQAADIVRSNAAVIAAMMAMLGGIFTMAISYMFEGMGLESYVGATIPVVLLRGLVAIVFGWILAAKMGCGIVAELGSMRISEEIDALEVMGVPSLPYLVVTRVVAGMVVLPAVFISGLVVDFEASKLFGVNLLHSVSPGGFSNVEWAFQGPREFFIALVWSLVVSFGVMTIACYFGYHASGGPVGVGLSTAKSMLVNLLFISISAMALSQLFFGGNPGSPLGN